MVAVIVSQRSGFFETVLRSRTSLGGGSTRVHLEIYELLPPVIGEHPLFGLGLNTFSTYYEFVTGESNWGPHSYYVALLTETGIIGTAVFGAYLVYLCGRLRLLHRIGSSLARAGDAAATRVRPLAWGLTAALAGTLAANAFYLTMQMYYFFVLAMFIIAAPLVFGTRIGRARRVSRRATAWAYAALGVAFVATRATLIGASRPTRTRRSSRSGRLRCRRTSARRSSP